MAWAGREALNVIWDAGSHSDLNTETLEERYRQALNQQGKVQKKVGDTETALYQAIKKITAVYELPYLYHASPEPPNCTAYVQQHRCDIWAPTQIQTRNVQAATEITGLKPEQIHLHTTYVGGSFGRKVEEDFVTETLWISKITGKPIKLVWTREEDVQHSYYRPASVTSIEGGIDNNGNIIAWHHRIACSLIPYQKHFVSLVMSEGIEDTKYVFSNFYLEHIEMTLPIRVGFLRSVGYSHNTFVVETFMDELAYLANIDPLTFRINHLKHDSRATRVLEIVAEKAGWGKPLKNDRGRGIAQSYFDRGDPGSYSAYVAEVSVNQENGIITVHRVVIALDCGIAVHPDMIVAQLEGGTIMGLSMALKEKLEFDQGGVKSSNFHDYQLLRMDETPEVEVHIVDSSEKPSGVGDITPALIAPAVANAVFNLTGVRLRCLPMTPKIVLDALKNKWEQI